MSKSKYIVLITVAIILILVVSSVSFITLNKTNVTDDSYKEIIANARDAIWLDINSGKASSGTIAIMDEGQIVYEEGFAMADRENSTPVTPQTLYNIGSISKTFCTVAVMKLVDDGKINLEDNITKYLPDLVMADPRYRDITVRMLLDHSCGLPGTISANDVGYAYNPNFYQDTLKVLSQAHLRSTPGEIAPYTNDGFSVAEMIVARVSGLTYPEYLSQNVIKPLQLDHTGTSVGQQTDKTIANYYRLDNGKSTPPEVMSVLGAGGLSSTAADLTRFVDSFSKDGKHVLTQSSIDEITQAHPSPFALRSIQQTGINPEFSFGLGLDVAGLPYYHDQGLTVIGKGGDTSYYHSMLLSDIDHRVSVAVIETGQGCSAVKITFNTFDAILKQKGLLKTELAPSTESPAPQPIPANYSIFQGYYASNIKVTFDFSQNLCNVTLLSNGGSSTLQLTYSDGFFYLDSEKFAFRTVDGQNYLLSAIFNNMEYDVWGQQLPTLQNPQSLSSNINGEQWLRRNVQPYEDAAVSSTHIVTSRTFDDLKGYVLFSGLKEIKASDYAAMPSWAVRDQTELKLFNVDGQVWAQAYDCIYSPATLAKPIGIGTCSVTIGSDGYNQWFNVSQAATLSFLKPAWDRVIVYSGTGQMMYDSVLSTGDVSVVQGCLVEFAGYSGDTMAITAK